MSDTKVMQLYSHPQSKITALSSSIQNYCTLTYNPKLLHYHLLSKITALSSKIHNYFTFFNNPQLRHNYSQSTTNALSSTIHNYCTFFHSHQPSEIKYVLFSAWSLWVFLSAPPPPLRDLKWNIMIPKIPHLINNFSPGWCIQVLKWILMSDTAAIKSGLQD